MDDRELLGRLTAMCWGLPEATADDVQPPRREFVVGEKNLAWYADNEHGDGRVGLGVRVGDSPVSSRTDAPKRSGGRCALGTP
jgi:hypothetical protein